eukprot:scaffold2410_cov22-Prasinocladus_malaysianus.AAC.2
MAPRVESGQRRVDDQLGQLRNGPMDGVGRKPARVRPRRRAHRRNAFRPGRVALDVSIRTRTSMDESAAGLGDCAWPSDGVGAVCRGDDSSVVELGSQIRDVVLCAQLPGAAARAGTCC